MKLVIADTGPVNYLILIAHIDVLPILFDKIILPAAVRAELNNAPPLVQDWIASPSSWLEVRQAQNIPDLAMTRLDGGEQAAIALAVELQADLLLMDDRAGVKAAKY